MTPSSVRRSVLLEQMLRWGRTLLAAGSVGLALIYLLGLLGSISAVGRARAELRDRQAQRQKLRVAARRARLPVRAPATARQSHYLTSFIEHLDKLAGANGCKLLLVQPGPATAEAEGKPAPLQVNLLGSYRSLIRLVEALTTSGWPAQIQELAITSPPSGQGNQLSVQLSIVVDKLQ